MTIKQARKLLGKESESLTDEDLNALIDKMKIFASIIVERILNEKSLGSDK